MRVKQQKLILFWTRFYSNFWKLGKPSEKSFLGWWKPEFYQKQLQTDLKLYPSADLVGYLDNWKLNNSAIVGPKLLVSHEWKLRKEGSKA